MRSLPVPQCSACLIAQWRQWVKRKGQFRKIVIWLAGSLMHMNAQRPGAVADATVEEYRAATTTTQGRESYKTFYVSQHKTQTTGRAKLSAPANLYKLIDKYVDWVRPILEGSCNPRLLFPNRDGQPLDHLSRHVKSS